MCNGAVGLGVCFHYASFLSGFINPASSDEIDTLKQPIGISETHRSLSVKQRSTASDELYIIKGKNVTPQKVNLRLGAGFDTNLRKLIFDSTMSIN